MSNKLDKNSQKVNLLDADQPPTIPILNNNFNEESKSVIKEEKEE